MERDIKLEKILDKQNIEYAFNKAKCAYTKVKFLIVGDNPGKEEVEKHMYFIGNSGKILRSFFSKNNLVENFDKDCILFNKTIIHTNKTNDLNRIREDNKEFFDYIQIKCAKTIVQCAFKYNLPILIFGKNSLKPNAIFRPFWDTLIEKINTTEVYVFNHPSYGNLSREWNKYNGENNENKEELLFEIGKRNFEGLR